MNQKKKIVSRVALSLLLILGCASGKKPLGISKKLIYGVGVGRYAG